MGSSAPGDDKRKSSCRLHTLLRFQSIYTTTQAGRGGWFITFAKTAFAKHTIAYTRHTPLTRPSVIVVRGRGGSHTLHFPYRNNPDPHSGWTDSKIIRVFPSSTQLAHTHTERTTHDRLTGRPAFLHRVGLTQANAQNAKSTTRSCDLFYPESQKSLFLSRTHCMDDTHTPRVVCWGFAEIYSTTPHHHLFLRLLEHTKHVVRNTFLLLTF